MRRLALALVLFASCRSTSPQTPASNAFVDTGSSAIDDVTPAKKSVRESYERKDMPGFLEASRRLVQVAPNSPGAVYTLACAEAKNQGSDVSKLLAKLLGMRVYFDLTADEDFAASRSAPWFSRMTAAMKMLHDERIGSGGEELVRLRETDLTTEGIARDGRTGALFVSSVHRRKILRIAKDGAISDFKKSGEDGLFGVLGMDIDDKTRRLYACTSALAEMDGFTKADENRAAVVAFDLDTGELKLRATLDGAGPHACNDLAVDTDGSVIVSDTGAAALLRLPAGQNALSTLVPPGHFSSPQAIAVRPEALYVADYGRGIARVNRTTGFVHFLVAPDLAPMSGIDGLRAVEGGFVAIQNGFEPARIVTMSLSGDTLSLPTILASNDARWHEPTLGIVVDGALLYVAASQWGAFDREGKLLHPEALAPGSVMKLPLTLPLPPPMSTPFPWAPVL